VGIGVRGVLEVIKRNIEWCQHAIDDLLDEYPTDMRANVRVRLEYVSIKLRRVVEALNRILEKTSTEEAGEKKLVTCLTNTQHEVEIASS
jgi:hypothetical protein